jgi:uncharacterized protein (DUF983 family)
MNEESVAKGILTLKCPKCHKGRLFINQNPYNLSKIADMPHSCEKCGLDYQPEPGFYIGAMYVNYGFTVVLTAVTYVVLEIILGVSAWAFFSIYLTILILIGPLLFRYSRVIYLYLFVRYDKEALKKQN